MLCYEIHSSCSKTTTFRKTNRDLNTFVSQVPIPNISLSSFKINSCWYPFAKVLLELRQLYEVEKSLQRMNVLQWSIYRMNGFWTRFELVQRKYSLIILNPRKRVLTVTQLAKFSNKRIISSKNRTYKKQNARFCRNRNGIEGWSSSWQPKTAAWESLVLTRKERLQLSVIVYF